MKELDKQISEVLEHIISIRRYIHQNPELGYEEKATSKLVAQELKSSGLAVQEGVGGYGVVGILEGNHPGKILLLRADMDALPIEEETGLSFSSKIPGIMHACGHDIHTAILLGVARVLSKYKDFIAGQIKFVFQPAEECSPQGGAQKMIKEGILENPDVDYALALHVWPQLYVGEIGLCSGPCSAKSDRFFLKVTGKSGHASAPHQGIDALVAAADIISSMQTIVSRRVDPKDSIVISIGKITGGQRYNVICDKVEMEGTVRIMTPGYEDEIMKYMNQVGQGIVQAHGASFEMNYLKGYPMVINDACLTQKVKEILTEKIGEDAVKNISQDTSGEDFSFISQKVPSVYMKLGSSPKDAKEVLPLHNSRVIFDEGCIPFGIKALAALSLELLQQEE
ncbi:M20 metallopeptidase family protein [Tepidanaerobacter acetatoxydans]|uniref:M20 metallopeptidase family protein n=1 Tax=Tepidanaerobacter acetatoxydans TaxID=499229 RepID=UPI001BD2D3BB|nr:amidohydrolase [Tepidanaerobacter acetatoxydans]